jgi:hypothetical protein
MARYTPPQQRAQKLMRDFVRYCAIRKRLARRRACLIAKPIHTTPISNPDSEAESTSTTTSSCTIFSSLDSESTSQASDSSSSYLSSRLSSADSISGGSSLVDGLITFLRMVCPSLRCPFSCLSGLLQFLVVLLCRLRIFTCFRHYIGANKSLTRSAKVVH